MDYKSRKRLPLEQTRLKRVELKPQTRVLHLEFLPLVNNTSIHLFFILLRLILSFEESIERKIGIVDVEIKFRSNIVNIDP